MIYCDKISQQTIFRYMLKSFRTFWNVCPYISGDDSLECSFETRQCFLENTSEGDDFDWALNSVSTWTYAIFVTSKGNIGFVIIDNHGHSLRFYQSLISTLKFNTDTCANELCTF